jgi:plasmid stabilization system protein ParE
MNVRFTLEALAHIASIRLYIEDRSPAAATRIVARIFAETNRLGEFPELGHVGIVPGTFEWTIRGLPFVMVHELDGKRNEIIILGVFRASANPHPCAFTNHPLVSP